MDRTIILTCEHAGNQVPDQLAAFFYGASVALKTHRGWDIGAEELTRELHVLLHSQGFYLGQYSRLVVDLNRSIHHPNIFSQWTAGLNAVERDTLLETIYRPFRSQVKACIDAARAQGKSILHLSVHSFTPVLGDEVRNNDIGLLYDPQRKAEQCLAIAWEHALESQEQLPVRVRRNYPYRGVSDGHVTELRRIYPTDYLGFEVEVNQGFLELHAPETVARLLATTLPES